MLQAPRACAVDTCDCLRLFAFMHLNRMKRGDHTEESFLNVDSVMAEELSSLGSKCLTLGKSLMHHTTVIPQYRSLVQ